MKMNILLEAEMNRALKLLKALELAKEIEEEYETDATRHAKTELKLLFKSIRKHSVIFEKEWKA